MDSTPRAALAELIGTFVFFTIGAGAVVISSVTRGGIALLGIAFAHGIALALMVTIFGRVSGGHFNPAVTIGVWVGGKIRTLRAAAYIVAQLAGAVGSGYMLRLFFTKPEWNPVHLGTPALAPGLPVGRGVLIEAVLTFILLLAVWGTGVDPRGPKVAGFAIGLAVFVDILLGGPLTGAAMNPARAFGPAVASGYWRDHWVYWVGPVAGAVIASLVYRWFFYAEDHPPEQTASAHDRVEGVPHDLPGPNAPNV